MLTFPLTQYKLDKVFHNISDRTIRNVGFFFHRNILKFKIQKRDSTLIYESGQYSSSTGSPAQTLTEDSHDQSVFGTDFSINSAESRII
jgi:hypothetical protein